ncbi:MAG: LacI family DNA-binding transcriptional regulator [Litorimonas sp.]
MKTTITDVAKQAGVSMKTVSRVLNNEPNVAKATRERVREVAERLQYSPNLAARGLASSRSYLIGLIYGNPSPSYINNIQRGAIEACRAHGYHLLLEPMTLEQAEGEDLRARLRRSGVDGVILTAPLCDSQKLRKSLDALDIPFVAVAPEDPGEVRTVRMDDNEAAYRMTRFLIESGHSDIGFVVGPPDHAASALRLSGFRRALADSDLQVTPSRIVQGDFSFRSGVSAGQTLLKDRGDRPTAIFASNDDMATGVMSVAGRLGLAVPEEISICGFDDTPIARIIWPQLTTVAQPIQSMGYKAAEMLVSRTAEPTSTVHTLDFALVIRESTAPRH